MEEEKTNEDTINNAGDLENEAGKDNTEIRKETEQAWAERLGLKIDEPQPVPPPIPVMEEPRAPSSVPPKPPMPPTYMLWAILSMICCCMPAGIVAIVFAASVSTKYFAGDYQGAIKASRRVEIWVIASIVLGIVVNALYVPLSLMMPSH